MLELTAYLNRIGFTGTPAVDVETLREVHRLHLLAIAYENLDVQLAVPVSLDIEPIYRKLVEQRRGGWCYEMNGLLAWALEEIGFPVTRLAAGVMREVRGDGVLGNHLALWVELDQPYLADVGFGDGAFDPFQVRAGTFRQRGFDFALESLGDGWWRFHNQPHGSARSFDFNHRPADPELLRRQCHTLQTSAESPFTQVAVVQRHVADGLALMRGRVLTRVSPHGVERREVADQAEYTALLEQTFGLEVADIDTLWRKVEGQHAAFLERVAAGRQAAG